MKMISLFGGHLGLAGLSVQKLVVLVFRPGLEDALVRKILATDKTIKIKRGLARRELVLYVRLYYKEYNKRYGTTITFNMEVNNCSYHRNKQTVVCICCTHKNPLQVRRLHIGVNICKTLNEQP